MIFYDLASSMEPDRFINEVAFGRILGRKGGGWEIAEWRILTDRGETGGSFHRVDGLPGTGHPIMLFVDRCLPKFGDADISQKTIGRWLLI